MTAHRPFGLSHNLNRKVNKKFKLEERGPSRQSDADGVMHSLDRVACCRQPTADVSGIGSSQGPRVPKGNIAVAPRTFARPLSASRRALRQGGEATTDDNRRQHTQGLSDDPGAFVFLPGVLNNIECVGHFWYHTHCDGPHHSDVIILNVTFSSRPETAFSFPTHARHLRLLFQLAQPRVLNCPLLIQKNMTLLLDHPFLLHTVKNVPNRHNLPCFFRSSPCSLDEINRMVLSLPFCFLSFWLSFFNVLNMTVALFRLVM